MKTLQDSRVRISQTVDLLRIVIRSRRFPLGRSIPTLVLSVTVAVTGLLLILAFTIPGEQALLSLLAVISVLVNVFIFRFWMWYSFGEEIIDITAKDKKWVCFSVRRFNGLLYSKTESLPVIPGIELYSNRTDRWSWKQLREKGILRISSRSNFSANGNNASVLLNAFDFGAGLDDNDYEKVLSVLNPVFHSLNREPIETKVQMTEVPEPLPGLSKQLSGKHEQILRSFYEKYKRLKAPRNFNVFPVQQDRLQ